MEEPKKGFKGWFKGVNWWEKIDEVVLVGLLIPFLVGLGKKIIDKFGKKVDVILGLDLESAKEDTTDDYYFRASQVGLNSDERIKIYDFKHWLKERNKKTGPDEEGAFILYVAKMVKTFEREKREVSGGGKKDGDQRQECSYKDLEKGVALATGFFRDLLSKSDHKAMRHFLNNENVFSLIPKKKEESPIVKKAKEFAKKKVIEMANGEKANQQDLNQSAQSFERRARAFYKKSKSEKGDK